MNIAYFRFPKAGSPICTMTLPSASLENVRNRGYTAIPVITRRPVCGHCQRRGFLWRLLDTDDPSMKKAEELRVRDIIGSNTRRSASP